MQETTVWSRMVTQSSYLASFLRITCSGRICDFWAITSEYAWGMCFGSIFSSRRKEDLPCAFWICRTQQSDPKWPHNLYIWRHFLNITCSGRICDFWAITSECAWRMCFGNIFSTHRKEDRFLATRRPSMTMIWDQQCHVFFSIQHKCLDGDVIWDDCWLVCI